MPRPPCCWRVSCIVIGVRVTAQRTPPIGCLFSLNIIVLLRCNSHNTKFALKKCSGVCSVITELDPTTRCHCRRVLPESPFPHPGSWRPSPATLPRAVASAVTSGRRSRCPSTISIGGNAVPVPGLGTPPALLTLCHLSPHSHSLVILVPLLSLEPGAVLSASLF